MKKTLLSLSLVLGLAACTTGTHEHWTNFASSSVNVNTLKDNQALTVFYRQGDVAGPNVEIFVDGDYHAALFPSSISPVTLCADRHQFSSSFVSNTEFGQRHGGAKFTLPAKQITYIKVAQDNTGKTMLTRVEPAIAEQEIAGLATATQNLSRVKPAENCGTPVLESESLSANALFAINKSDYNDILPQGRAEIAEFAQRVNAMDKSKLGSITVSGHTDPVASDAYNQVLSQKRAETVKHALEQEGVTLPIKAVGLGKRELVVSNCEALHPHNVAAKTECNLPNRRVEITLYGK
ncbi:OmpA family protein [Conservatibacter flavescens]|uniref:OmpA-like domain-containing protein n=1 Tax=Conservatibacter flavescens TaxID=28161 RepID=A0A2M8S436_9PAST|nr:OmpA family protein [Conservatibacter flavescens]PJG85887.1 hypothetical protein CVP05_03910 [Conservatibacter flavescens]